MRRVFQSVVELVDGHLEAVWEETWTPEGREPSPPLEREVLVSSTLLRDFVELQGRPESEYLAFGRRWGLLGLCEHGLPASHASGAKRIEPGFRLSLLPEGCQGEGREAIRDWRSHVDRFRALLDIGGILSWDNTAPVSKWFELKPPETSEQRWRGFQANQSRARELQLRGC